MKHIIALLVLSISASFANAETVLAEVRGVSSQIKTVQLTDTGLLKVVSTTNAVSILQLTQTNSANLVFQAQELNGAATTTDHSKFVCMMILRDFNVQELYVVNGTNGGLELMISARACNLPDYTHPTNASALQSAETLKAQMIALAEQLAN